MMRNTFSSQEWLKFIGKEKLQTFQDSFARVDNISLCFFDLEWHSINSVVKLKSSLSPDNSK